MNVCVIGGGIIGCMTSYYLANKGYNVTIIEKNPKICMQASGANGSLLCFDSTFSIYTHEFYSKLTAKSIIDTFNINPKWIVNYAKRSVKYKEINNTLKELGFASYDEFKKVTNFNSEFKYSNNVKLFEHNLLQTNNTFVGGTIDLANMLIKHKNINIKYNTKMMSYNTKNKKIVSIIINDGTIIEADKFINCTGPDNKHILPVYGMTLIKHVKNNTYHGYLFDNILFQHLHNMDRITFGAECTFDKKDAKIKLLEKSNKIGFNIHDYDEVYIAARPLTPDGLPIICRDNDYSNLYHNFGHGFFGWTLSFISAKILIDLIENRENRFIHYLDINRFHL
jgi:glycine oxidase